MPPRSGSGSPLVVLTSELATVLKDWMKKHNGRFPVMDEEMKNFSMSKLNPKQMNKDEFDENWGFSAHRYIMEYAPIDRRGLDRVLREEYKVTSLSLADQLLRAIERTDALGNEIRVIPNPTWTQEHWIEEMKKQGCV